MTLSGRNFWPPRSVKSKSGMASTSFDEPTFTRTSGPHAT